MTAQRNAKESESGPQPDIVYKIVPDDLWRAAEQAGRLDGAPVDLADGFIHLSTAGQVRETARRHFAGQDDLRLVAVSASALGEALRYEPSRGGALFPHLYGPLPLSAVLSSEPLPLGPDGAHVFPALEGEEAGWTPAALRAAGWIEAETIGLMTLVGPLWIRGSGAEQVLAFRAEARHANLQGAVHGGMLMAFADEALGRVSFESQGRKPQVTVQLDTHFVSAARIGDLVEARCRIVRTTRSLLFMTGELVAGEQIVATANGVWKILRA